MTDLPEALSPWSRPLSLLPRELSLSLGPLVVRLALAIGPLRESEASRRGEVDGYDGLSARGPYERLLHSEWLLADELPDEFLRRAVAHEHAFFRLARREPGRARRSVALFDAGPMQLGAPRIAHLAALIVLAQRSVAAGAQFSFGVLQDPECRLVDEVTPASVQNLIDGRSPLATSTADFARWLSRLASVDGSEGTAPEADDDLWLVGDVGEQDLHGSDPALATATRLTAHDRMEPGARIVDVEITNAVRAGGTSRARTVELSLPAAEDCARLLRDPFRVAVARPSSSRTAEASLPSLPDASSPLVHAAGGHRLLVRLESGAVVAFDVPNSPRATVGRPVIFRPSPGATVIAAGFGERRLSLVTVAGTSVGYEQIGKNGGRRSYAELKPFREGSVLPDGNSGLHALHHRSPWSADRTATQVFLDGSGRVFELSGGYFRELCDETTLLAVGPRRGSILAIRSQTTPLGRREREVISYDTPHGDSGMRIVLDLGGSGPLEAYAGCGGHLCARFGLLAVRIEPDVWRIFYRPRQDAPGAQSHIDVHPPSGTRPVGVAVDPAATDPSLVIIEEDGRTIALLDRRTERSRHVRLPRATSPIASASCSSDVPLISWLTDGGEIVVYSLERGEHILRLRPGESVDGGVR